MANNVQSFKDRLKKMRDEAPAKGRSGNYITGAGRFRVEILSSEKIMALDKAKLQRGIQDRNQPAFVCEFRIKQSDNAAHPVGSTASWYVKDPEGTNLEDIARLMLALQGHEPRAVIASKAANPTRYESLRDQADGWALAAMNDADALNCLGLEAGFLTGLEVELETRLTTTKAGGSFTVHEWSPTAEAAADPIVPDAEPTA